MIKRSRRKPPSPKKFYRINERIYANSLRVLGPDGKQIGVLPKFEALSRARAEGLDLVEIAPTATPPVAKIIDFNKFMYQEEKKKREEKRKSKASETKELRLGPFMDDNDLMVIVRKAREFLGDGNKVKFVVKFAGRQITHPEFGEEILKKAIIEVSDISKVEKEKHFEGRRLISILAPDKVASKKKSKDERNEIGNAEEKNQEISQ